MTPPRREVPPRRVTPELMAFHKRRGRELRDAAWRAMWRGLWTWIKTLKREH